MLGSSVIMQVLGPRRKLIFGLLATVATLGNAVLFMLPTPAVTSVCCGSSLGLLLSLRESLQIMRRCCRLTRKRRNQSHQSRRRPFQSCLPSPARCVCCSLRTFQPAIRLHSRPAHLLPMLLLARSVRYMLQQTRFRRQFIDKMAWSQCLYLLCDEANSRHVAVAFARTGTASVGYVVAVFATIILA